MDPDKVPAIAIDLGSTYSCVGAFVNGKVEIFTNDEGFKKTPSYVAFTELERLIGESAKDQAGKNPENTIFDTKRLIGRRFIDPLLQKDIGRWPFTVVDSEGRPMIKVVFQEQEMLFTPEEISSMVLSKLKVVAETYFGGLVHDAVLTVPTHFNDSQRQATKDAGSIAGLRVVKVLNDTTAAALAYGLGQNLSGKRNVLIVDLGGGSFDVSVLSISKGSIFEVKSTAGNAHLGGRDFDYRLVDYLMNECKRKYKTDVSGNPKAVKRLLLACESAKKTLTSSPEASVEIEALFGNIDFRTKISRARFEALCSDLFSSILGPVQLALSDAKLDRHQIHDVVLVGGSTRIPKIQRLLQDFFSGTQLIKSVNPDEAVTYGAVLQAAILCEDKSNIVKDVLVIDATALSIGTEAENGAMNVIIRRGTALPIKVSSNFTTSTDNQTAFTIQVFEGERAWAKDNNLLGQVELSGIDPAPKGIPQITVNFQVDYNGILYVTAQNKNSAKGNLTVLTNKGRPTADDIHRMILEIDVFKMVEEKQRQRLLLMNKLETYIFDVKRFIEIHDDQVRVEDRTRAKKACEKVLIWLESNRHAPKEDFQQKLVSLKAICSPVISQLIGCSSSS